MPASVHFEPITGIWIFLLSSVVELKEVLEADQAMRAEFDPTAPRLWDFRQPDATRVIDAIALREADIENGLGELHAWAPCELRVGDGRSIARADRRAPRRRTRSRGSG